MCEARCIGAADLADITVTDAVVLETDGLFSVIKEKSELQGSSLIDVRKARSTKIN
jgi:hypothetical protein